MSEENIELVRLAYDLFNRRDIEAFLDLADPEIEWHDHAAFDTGPVRGREAVRAFIETGLEPWEAFRRDPEEIIDVDNGRVLSVFRARAKGKASGIELDVRAADLVTIKGGKFVRYDMYPVEDAYAAAGLTDPLDH